MKNLETSSKIVSRVLWILMNFYNVLALTFNVKRYSKSLLIAWERPELTRNLTSATPMPMQYCTSWAIRPSGVGCLWVDHNTAVDGECILKWISCTHIRCTKLFSIGECFISLAKNYLRNHRCVYRIFNHVRYGLAVKWVMYLIGKSRFWCNDHSLIECSDKSVAPQLTGGESHPGLSHITSKNLWGSSRNSIKLWLVTPQQYNLYSVIRIT